MTSLGFRLVIPVHFLVFWPFSAAWEAQACHPSPFRGFLVEKGSKNPKRAGKLLTKTSNSQRLTTTETVIVMEDEKATYAMEAVSTLEMQPLMGMGLYPY